MCDVKFDRYCIYSEYTTKLRYPQGYVLFPIVLVSSHYKHFTSILHHVDVFASVSHMWMEGRFEPMNRFLDGIMHIKYSM